MMKKKGVKGKHNARHLKNMTRFKTDPIWPVDMPSQTLKPETPVQNPTFLTKGNSDLSRMRSAWSTIMEDMNKLALELHGQSPWLTRSVERLRSSTSEMNNDLLVYVEDSYGHMVKLQGLWMTRMSNMSKELIETIMNGSPLFSLRTNGNKRSSTEHRTL
jgi:hypothetical protein